MHIDFDPSGALGEHTRNGMQDLILLINLRRPFGLEISIEVVTDGRYDMGWSPQRSSRKFRAIYTPSCGLTFKYKSGVSRMQVYEDSIVHGLALENRDVLLDALPLANVKSCYPHTRYKIMREAIAPERLEAFDRAWEARYGRMQKDIEQKREQMAREVKERQAKRLKG